MTNKELIDSVIELYRIAKNSTEKFKSHDIKRGRNHSISSQTEDLLAYFLLKKIDQPNIEFWVDYPVSYKTASKMTKKGNIGTKTIYPDISIVKKVDADKFEILEMIDLKMDLGWKRNLSPYLDEKKKLIEEIRNISFANYKKVDEQGFKTKETSEVSISKKVFWRIPVISDQNIDEEQMQSNISYSNQDQFKSFLKLYVFTNKHHPNSGKADINDLEINSFVIDIKENIK